jgi:hypothetical protein
MSGEFGTVAPQKLLLEGLDRLGKDTLAESIQHLRGYHQVLHFQKPISLRCYECENEPIALRRYQEASFQLLFQLLRDAPAAKLICNRAHLGECVYAPIYRGYSGEYVFDIEATFDAHKLRGVRLILLTEDFEHSRHFVEDGSSLGGAEKRPEEQARFLAAFERSTIPDKRIVCVTDSTTGAFRTRDAILEEVLA